MVFAQKIQNSKMLVKEGVHVFFSKFVNNFDFFELITIIAKKTYLLFKLYFIIFV